MNQDIHPSRVAGSGPVRIGSPELERLIALVGEGAFERDRDRLPPHGVIDLIRQARLGALRLPVAHGGTGSSLRDLFEIVIRLADADSNVAHIVRNHFAFVEKCLRATEGDDYRRWFDEIASGSIFGLGSTELGTPNIGAAGFITTLTPDKNGYALTGTKYYSTGNLYSDFIAVRATLDDGRSASVIIPAGRKGVTIEDDWDGIGQTLTASGTTRLDNVRVEADEVLFDLEAANRLLPYQATFPQLYLTAILAGILRNIVRDATALIRRRDRTYYHAPAERPVDDPILQQIIGQIASNAFAAETIVLAAADAMDQSALSVVDGIPDPDLAHRASLLAAKAKIVVDDIALKSASLLFDVGGASAVKQSHRLDRHWRNVRTLVSHNPGPYKARSIGAYELNGTNLPTGAFF